MRTVRSDKGKRRKVSEEVQKAIEGLCLRADKPPVAWVHREVAEICRAMKLSVPSYMVVLDIYRQLDKRLKVLVHEYIKKKTEDIGVAEPSADVRTVIATCSKGNPRTLGHLFALIQKILKINADIVQEITPEVIEAARKLMLVGSTVKSMQSSLASAV